MRFDRVLVTGGSGRLGCYIVDELKDRCRVTTLDAAPAATAQPHLTVDIMDLPALMKAMRGFDAVVHAAALDGHRAVGPEDFFRVNVQGTWNVLHAAFEAGVRKAVVSSSNAASGISLTERHMPPLYLPMDEAHPARPHHAYGLGKYLNEVTAESFARRGMMAVTTIRPTYIMFPELVAHAAKRVAAPDRGFEPLAGAEAEKLPEPFRERFGVTRAYVEPADLARLYRLALEQELKTHEVFYAAAEDTYEPEPTLPFIAGVYGTLPPVRKPEVYERNPHASTIDCTKAEQLLGWQPTSEWTKLSGAKRR
jgi:nucleoside-diphosphate-sugar epimerase